MEAFSVVRAKVLRLVSRVHVVGRWWRGWRVVGMRDHGCELRASQSIGDWNP